jgi:hypothetical protein
MSTRPDGWQQIHRWCAGQPSHAPPTKECLGVRACTYACVRTLVHARVACACAHVCTFASPTAIIIHFAPRTHAWQPRQETWRLRRRATFCRSSTYLAIFCAFSLCLLASVALPAAKQLAAMRTCVGTVRVLCAEVVVGGRGGLMLKGAKGLERDEMRGQAPAASSPPRVLPPRLLTYTTILIKMLLSVHQFGGTPRFLRKHLLDWPI